MLATTLSGDTTNRLAVNSEGSRLQFGRAMWRIAIAGKRWAIEHLFVSRPEQLARMKRLDLVLARLEH